MNKRNLSPAEREEITALKIGLLFNFHRRFVREWARAALSTSALKKPKKKKGRKNK